jgi:hypothetical protein
MKTLISAIIAGLAGGLSAGFISWLILQRLVVKFDKALNVLEEEVKRQSKFLNEIDTALGLLDKEIDKVKNRQKD